MSSPPTPDRPPLSGARGDWKVSANSQARGLCRATLQGRSLSFSGAGLKGGILHNFLDPRSASRRQESLGGARKATRLCRPQGSPHAESPIGTRGKIRPRSREIKASLSAVAFQGMGLSLKYASKERKRDIFTKNIAPGANRRPLTYSRNFR